MSAERTENTTPPEERGAVIAKVSAKPTPMPAEQMPKQQSTFRETVAHMGRMLQEDVVSDVKSAKDAGVAILKGKADKEAAQAKAKAAEAAEAHARADVSTQEAALKALDVANRLEEGGEREEAQVLRKVAAAVAEIGLVLGLVRTAGGDPTLDANQIVKLLGRDLAKPDTAPQGMQADSVAPQLPASDCDES